MPRGPACRSAIPRRSAALISLAENEPERVADLRDGAAPLAWPAAKAPVLGITGTGGAGKSSLVDELVRRFLADFPDKHHRHHLGRSVAAARPAARSSATASA